MAGGMDTRAVYVWVYMDTGILVKGLKHSLVWPVDSACAVLLVRSASCFLNNVINVFIMMSRDTNTYMCSFFLK